MKRLLLVSLLFALLAVTVRASPYDEDVYTSEPVPLDFPIPLEDIADQVEMSMAAMKQSFNEAPDSLEGMDPQPHECGHCVRHFAEHAMNETIKAVVKLCNETECPYIKMQCDWMAWHKQRTFGYLVGRVRPVSRSFLYCAGAQQCPIHPNGTNETDACQGSKWDWKEEQEDGILAATTLEQVMPPLKISNLPSTVMEQLDGMDFDDDPELSSSNHSLRCYACTRTVTNVLLDGFIDVLRFACHNTSCEHAQKFCRWARNHVDFVKGYLAARVKPSLFAAGLCVGKGACKHHRKPTALEIMRNMPSIVMPTVASPATATKGKEKGTSIVSVPIRKYKSSKKANKKHAKKAKKHARRMRGHED